MNINQPSLIQFEEVRKTTNQIPPGGSNSFFDVGRGKINLFTIRDTPTDYRFDMTIDQGKVYTGAGNFVIAGEDTDITYPYRNFTILSNAELAVNQFMTVRGGELSVHGTLELLQNSQLRIYGGHAVTHPNSILVINDKTNLSVEPGSTLTIYGRVDVHISVIDSILNAPGVIVDSAAVMNVDGIEETERQFSLTNYEVELRERFVNVNTQGEKNLPKGRLGYLWRKGSPKEPSQVLAMNILVGEHPLGDFRLPVLGIPVDTIPQMQTISSLHVRRGTTLNITENFHNERFIRPELYLGVIIGNTEIPADCLVDGTIIVNGINSLVTLDRGGTLRISESGTVHLRNGARIRSTHNTEIKVLQIEGLLIIDDLSQIETFNADNITFGPNGKVIVLNPDIGEKRLLFTTPNGILETTLYRLFRDRIDHIEYHVSPNCGIGIDQFYENYSRDMTLWYGDRRFEKAIHDGILIWHKGAYIEVYNHITPFIDENSTLLQVGYLFKSFGSYDKDRLQDFVDRLRYAGCTDILFRFIRGEAVSEVILTVEACEIDRVFNNPVGMKYIVETTNEGTLYLRNRISNSKMESLLYPVSRRYEISESHDVEFTLP